MKFGLLELYTAFFIALCIVSYFIGSSHGYWTATDEICNGTQVIINDKVSCATYGTLITTNNMEDMVFLLPSLNNGS